MHDLHNKVKISTLKSPLISILFFRVLRFELASNERHFRLLVKAGFSGVGKSHNRSVNINCILSAGKQRVGWEVRVLRITHDL